MIIKNEELEATVIMLEIYYVSKNEQAFRLNYVAILIYSGR